MNKPLPLLPITLTALAAMLLTGCIHTTHEIKPIHITLDINLKVDRALDDFFSDIDQAPALPTQTSATENTATQTTPTVTTATSDKESN